MKPTYEVWLDIVQARLAAGDKPVDAIRTAQVVTSAYGQRFSFISREAEPQMTPEQAKAWFENLQQQAPKNENIGTGPTVGSYVTGDPNAR